MILLFSILICFASHAWSQSIFSIEKDVLISDLSLQMQGQNLAPTKPITSVQVVKVYSTTYQAGETIQKGQISTNYHHEGKEIYVFTFEQGEGIEPYVTIRDIDLPAKYQKDMVAVCEKNGQITDCDNGGEFLGRIRSWDISLYGNGKFMYQIRSASPGNKPFFTRLQIN